jgi:hypothetical protein
MKNLILIFFVLFGCRDDGLHYVKEIKPDIIVHPTELNFGHLLSGHETKTDRVTVINAGNSDLFLDELLLDDPNSRYTLTYDELDLLEPEQIMDVEITYDPETYEENPATLTIISNDEETSHIDVTIAGWGDAPILKVFPEENDMGKLFIGCDSDDQITFMNLGNLDLVVDDITQLTSLPQEIFIDYGSLPVFPWTLVPGEYYKVAVNYKPRDIGADDSRLSITSNDPMRSSYEIQQFGEGIIEEWFIDSWEQEEVPVLDILWVIDNSGSMHPFQTMLSNQINGFMNAFIAVGADYNMAFITTDRDYAQGQIINNATTDPIAEASAIISAIGITGHGMEKGIEMSVDALSSSSKLGPGSTFFREDAYLVVIYVSDEKDWSSPGWSSYTGFFDNLKQGNFMPFAVIGDPPTGCSYNWRNIQYGSGYWDLVDYYGGTWYSICAADWGSQLQSLGNQVIARSRFNLSEVDPVEETIKVFVDGQELEEGWYYDSGTNQIAFEPGHVPEPGETIRVEYALWGC